MESLPFFFLFNILSITGLDLNVGVKYSGHVRSVNCMNLSKTFKITLSFGKKFFNSLCETFRNDFPMSNSDSWKGVYSLIDSTFIFQKRFKSKRELNQIKAML